MIGQSTRVWPLGNKVIMQSLFAHFGLILNYRLFSVCRQFLPACFTTCLCAGESRTSFISQLTNSRLQERTTDSLHLFCVQYNSSYSASKQCCQFGSNHSSQWPESWQSWVLVLHHQPPVGYKLKSSSQSSFSQDHKHGVDITLSACSLLHDKV